MNVPTQLLGPILALVLLLALVAIGRLVRGWVQAQNSDTVEAENKDLIALEDRKEQLLTTLRDLEFEHATGKLSDDDYDNLKRFFEAEAVGVIRSLDQVSS